MIRLALRVDRAHAEVALAELLELAPGGVEEVDLGDAVEYAVYGPPGELPALPDLEAAVGGALVSVTTTELPDDWSERWKQFHHPLVLGERLAVRPPWEQALGTDVELVIDPAQAFGTGAHATTRLCLELLLSLADASAERGPVLDLGCGSGVLAIAGAKLGFGPVLAVDFDPLSVEATAANAVVNDVTLEVARCDLRSDLVPAAPIVLANLLRPLLLDYARLLSGGGQEAPHTVIASGLLVHEADEIAAAFAALGLHEQDRRERGEWAALLLTRPA
ncbi:MAG TPA: 50S ribosomal protein L11 methyltransferase [Conexibacter sp.]|jgi:ribosomal protein L11 methyltransferase|nr:50S ribosomal protein L11 methyltransferase [Conexibacter sp.]